MRNLVIGDLILDVYHYGKPLHDSVEGVPTIRKDRREVSYGGAGLLVRNILRLGGKLCFVSAVGRDAFGEVARKFNDKNLQKFFVSEPGMQTTVKERFVVGGKKVLKWNHLNEKAIGKSSEKNILSFIKKHLKFFDKLVISDYRHGLISKSLARNVIKLAKKFKKPVYVDSQIAQSQGNHEWYQGADLVCLNILEAQSIDRQV